MITVRVANEAKFKAQVSQWFNKAKKEISNASKGVAVEAFKYIISHGPQYSGDFVANINLSVGTPSPRFQENILRPYRVSSTGPYLEPADGFPRHEGHPQAVSVAVAKALPALSGYKFGQSLFISSAAVHGDDPYAFKIEGNKIKFRDANPSGGATFAKARQFIMSKYGGKVSMANLMSLQNVKLSSVR